jgi:hypothetical protein
MYVINNVMKHILYIYICSHYISVISRWLHYRPIYRYFLCGRYYLVQGSHCRVIVVLCDLV